MAFRCGLNSSHFPHFECMSGSVCTWDPQNGVEFCACPAGFSHDYVGFGHFPNCSLPDWYLLAFFLTYSIIFWPLFLNLVRKFAFFEGSGRIRRVTNRAVAFSFSSWLHCMCVFIEKGFFEASLVSLALLTISGFSLAHYCSLLVFEPILRKAGFREFSRTVQPWLSKLTAVLYLAVLGFVAAMIVFCRREDNILYNRLMLVFICHLVAVLILTTGAITWAGHYIRRLMPPEATTINLQLNNIVMVAGANLLVACGTCVIIVIWGVYSSFPYLYIQWSICQVLVLILLISIGPLLKASKARTGETTRKSSSHRHDGTDDLANISGELTDGASSTSVKGLGIKSKRIRAKSKSKALKAMTRITEISEAERATPSQWQDSIMDGSETIIREVSSVGQS